MEITQRVDSEYFVGTQEELFELFEKERQLISLKEYNKR